jgi:hypothetical protein
VPDPVNGNMQVTVRRRRTRRHRRNRQIRRWLALGTLGVLTVSVSTFALMYFSPSLFRAGQSSPSTFEQSERSRSHELIVDRILAHTQVRPVYPYSVVPGGVEDAKELKWIAEHDPVVGAHYAGFDYDRARLVQLTQARTVYLSYRIGNRIYWTRRRVTLHKGQLNLRYRSSTNPFKRAMARPCNLRRCRSSRPCLTGRQFLAWGRPGRSACTIRLSGETGCRLRLRHCLWAFASRPRRKAAAMTSLLKLMGRRQSSALAAVDRSAWCPNLERGCYLPPVWLRSIGVPGGSFPALNS